MAEKTKSWIKTIALAITMVLLVASTYNKQVITYEQVNVNKTSIEKKVECEQYRQHLADSERRFNKIEQKLEKIDDKAEKIWQFLASKG